MHMRHLATAILATAFLGPLALASSKDPCANVTPVSLLPPPNLVMPLAFRTTSQVNADCIAWQEFFYLNWAADPANPGQPDPAATVADFGLPNDAGQSVWESFMTADEVFNPTTQTTAAVGAATVAGNATGKTAGVRAATYVKTLSRLSMLGDADVNLNGVQQAGSNSWLTDQSGNPVFYEVHINKDEYQFITGNTLTTFAGQAACGGNPGTGGGGGKDANGGFNLPAGGGKDGTSLDYNCSGTQQVYGQNLGSIEIKASWRVLPSDGSLNYRYKIASATLTLPDGSTEKATVGLVGLHIIHKVPGAPQFIWATFEQIDNDPDAATAPAEPTLPAGAPSLLKTYNFYNANCNPSTDVVYGCVQNTTVAGQSSLPACAAGIYIPGKCYPYWAPMQITRVAPVATSSNTITAHAWAQLPSGSVFNYYRLIDVQWPSTPTDVPPQATVPLSRGNIVPASATFILANTTMETFLQKTYSCIECHQNAAVASAQSQTVSNVGSRLVRRVLVIPAATSGQAPYASDYSFIFSAETHQ
jgi:hypothetical protein